MLVLLFALTIQTLPPPSAAPSTFTCTAPEYRQFDFWLGEWDVVSNPATAPNATPGATSRPPASNVVTRIQDGCVILETWDDRAGGTGQSFNVYDRVREQWHQTWVSNNGGLHFYWGELRDGRMVYTGEVPLGPAMRFQGRRTVRVTFTPLGPDSVRQFAEALNTDGTWSPDYDLIYTRRRGAK